jgi:CRP-like cAMP-binding protein
VKTLEDLLAEVPAFVGLSEAHLGLIAGCGQNVVLEAGQFVFREGDPANEFFAIRQGSVALEITPPVGSPLVVETLHAGDLLGWSWLFSPYRVRFDARVVDQVHAVSFDGACLRGKCEADHELGYRLMQRFAAIMSERLQATRLRLLDVYGPGGS